MQNTATAYNRHALVQAERAQARKHGTLWGGGRGLRPARLLSPHARAAGLPQNQLPVLGSPAEATGGGQRKRLVSRGRELTQERNAQPASEGKGESTFILLGGELQELRPGQGRRHRSHPPPGGSRKHHTCSTGPPGSHRRAIRLKQFLSITFSWISFSTH